jgi:hypothetical protein
MAKKDDHDPIHWWLHRLFAGKKSSGRSKRKRRQQSSDYSLEINEQRIPISANGHLNCSWEDLLQQQQYHQMSIPATGQRMRVSEWEQAMPIMPDHVWYPQAQRSGCHLRSVSPDIPPPGSYHSEFATRDHSQPPISPQTARHPSPSRQHSRTSNYRQRSPSVENSERKSTSSSHKHFPSANTSERKSTSSSHQRSSNHLSKKTHYPKTSQPSTLPITKEANDRLPTYLSPIGDSMRTSLPGLADPTEWGEIERAQKAREQRERRERRERRESQKRY